MRLFRRENPTGAPLALLRISNTENGRRNNGSWPAVAFTITNCPGVAASAIAGAASDSTL
jgi:hypothetical protein